MRKLLQDFASEGRGAEPHSPILFIGNDKTGAWTTASSFAPPERLVKLIDQIAAPLPPGLQELRRDVQFIH